MGCGSRARAAAVLATGAIVALLLGGGVRAASVSGLRQLVPRVVRFVSDGEGYVAWQVSDGSPVTIFDTLSTGRRKEVALPSGCRLREETSSGEVVTYSTASAANAGRFLIECANRQALLDAATGALTPLPSRIGWGAVGQRYVEGDARNASCARSDIEVERNVGCIALYDIGTGAVTYRSEKLFAELDRPGAPPICVRLRADLLAPLVEEFDFSDGLFVTRASVDEGVRYEGCRGRVTVLTERGPTENFDARGGLLTWDTGATVQSGNARHGGKLLSYEFASKKRHSWVLPVRPVYAEVLKPELVATGAYGYSSHTKNMVFWIAARSCTRTVAGCETETWSVDGAAL